MTPYAEALYASGGAMPEFVNPKYTDATKEAFKAPARLECMMQVTAMAMAMMMAMTVMTVMDDDADGR